jgi:catechol 2,3-dioxygenase-like lactoylglutathione lyase family enzyme
MTARLSGASLDAGIISRNAEQMVAFYGGFLGLEITRTMEFPEQGARAWFFGVGDSSLKLIGLDDPPAQSNPPGDNIAATGLRYLTIQVLDLEEALAGVDESPGRLQSPIHRYGDNIVAFVEDPDGNSIELYEAKPEG